MAQHPIELILLRQWASYLAVPIWITNHEGNLIFYNEPAERMIGLRFDEAGELPADELTEIFNIVGLDGKPIPEEDRPLITALRERKPAHSSLQFRRPDGTWRRVEVTALPIDGEGDRHLGVMAAFWEIPE